MTSDIAVLQSAWDAQKAAVDAAAAADAAINHEFEVVHGGQGTAEMEQAWNDAGEHLWKAEWHLFDLRAPNLAALRWKLQLLAVKDLCFDKHQADTLIADVTFLMGEAA